MASCSIIRDSENRVVKVLAPNGKESFLYKQALLYLDNNTDRALKTWAIPYTNKFKLRYGDWEKGDTFLPLDENGEPNLDVILHLPKGINNIIKTEFANWEQFQPGEDGWVNQGTAVKFLGRLKQRYPEIKAELTYNSAFPGKAKIVYHPSPKQINTKFTADEINRQKVEVNKVVDHLLTKFPGVTVEWIKPSQLKQEDHYEDVDNINAYVKNNKVYLVEGRVLPEDGIEELMHVLVEGLRTTRPNLFKGLIDSAMQDPKYAGDYLALKQEYEKRAKGTAITRAQLDNLINSEFLAKTLAKAMKRELEMNPEGRPTSAFGKLIQRFLDWLSSVFDGNAITPEDTIEKLVEYINSKDIVIPLPESSYLFYSANQSDPSLTHDPTDKDDTQLKHPNYKNKTRKELNLEKAQEELDSLEEYKRLLPTGITRTAQSAVIDKLIQNVIEKKAAIEADADNIGSTKYKGSIEMENPDTKATEIGANFGNFYHMLAEDIQKEVWKTGKAPSVIFNDPEYFEKFYNAHKKLIQFKNVDVNLLKEIGNRLASRIDAVISEGKILIPEIGIGVNDIDGTMVIGRLDLLAVDLQGRVEIIDIKTKKQKGSSPIKEFPRLLFTYKNPPIKAPFKQGVDPVFAGFRNRSALNEYQIQTSIYREMLEKIGIPVVGRTIWAIAYHYNANAEKLADATEFTLTSFGMGTFRDADFYSEEDKNSIGTTRNYGEAVDAAARSRFKTAEEIAEVEPNAIPEVNPFAAMDEETQNLIIDKLFKLGAEQLDAINKEINELDANTVMDESLKKSKRDLLIKRKQGIQSFRAKIELGFKGDSAEALAKSRAIVIKAALEVFESEVQSIDNKIKELEIPATYEIGNLQNNNVLKDLHKYITILDNLNDYIKLIKSTVLSIPNLDEESKATIDTYLGNMSNNISRATQKNVAVGKAVFKAVIMKVIGPEKWEKVFGDMKKLLTPRLEWMDKTIAALESGQTNLDTIGSKISTVLGNLFSSNKNKADMLTTLKAERERIADIINMGVLNEKTLDTYLEGIINNPNGGFYMGSTIPGNNPVISIDSIIGDNSNSEAAISAIFQYMRNVTEEGNVEWQNWMYELGVDKLKSDYIDSKGGVEAANRAVTEEVERVLEFDQDGNPTIKEKYRQYKDPVSAAFYNEYDKWKDRLKKINDAITEKNKQIRESTLNTPERTALEEERKQLNEKKEQLNKEWIEWQIENVSTKYKPEVMRLLYASGPYNARVAELLEEIHSIIMHAQGEHLLTDEDQDQIDTREDEISKIRQEMLENEPGMADQMDELLSYFQFDLNVGLWTRNRERIIATGTPAQVERWDEFNSKYAPTQQYLDEVDSIFQRINEISQKDPVFDGLLKERQKIKSRHMVRGKFDFNQMTDTEVQKYQEIEDKMEQRKREIKDDPSSPLTQDQKMRLNELFGRLSTLRSKVISPDYIKKRDRLKQNVEKAYAIVRDLSAKIQEADARGEDTRALRDSRDNEMAQYHREEEIFAAFFNRNNYTTYKRGSIGPQRIDLHEQVRAHAYVFMPNNANHMELVPGKKYRIKRLKNEALNPDYQESFVAQKKGAGMYPMPKGHSFNSTTNEFEVTSDAKWVNQAFFDEYRDPNTKAFYTKWIVENFLKKQKLASGRPLGFNIPFVEQSLTENVLFKGVEGIKREVQERIQELTYASSEFEKATNESGIAGVEKIKFKENTAMPANLTTADGIGALINWNSGFYTNKKLANAEIEVSAILDYLKDLRGRLSDQKDSQDKVNKIDTIIKQAEFNKKKFIYGQLYDKGQTTPIFNRKTARMFMKLASFGRMAFDIPMQVGNLLSGNVQAFLSTSNSRFANSEDYAIAKKLIYTQWLPRLIGDWGKLSDVSIETKIWRYMNASGKSFDKIMDSNTASKIRRMAGRMLNFGELSMVLQDKGEFEIALTTMLMILNHRKFEQYEVDALGNVVIENGIKKVKTDANGETIFVRGTDVFTEVNGQIVLRPDVNISEKEMTDLKGTIMTEIYNFQGNYSQYTSTLFGSTLIGTLFNFYRKYLVPAVSTRFKFGGFEGMGSAYSWDAPEAYMGWYVALGRMVQYYGAGKAAKTLLYDTLLPGFVKNKLNLDTGIDDQDYYRPRAAMAAREVLLAVAFYMMYQALRSSLKNNDEDDLSYAELMMIRTLVKVSNESRSLVPAPIIGKPNDYIDNFGQFTTAFKEGKTVWDLVQNAMYYADYETTGSDFAYERGYYQRDTDRYMEGDPKLWKNVSDLSSWSNIKDVMSTEGAYDAAKRATAQK
jgi:hypothetical protein